MYIYDEYNNNNWTEGLSKNTPNAMFTRAHAHPHTGFMKNERVNC